MNQIKQKIPAALSDQVLQKNLKSNCDRSIDSRNSAVVEVENWEELRAYARRVKEHTLSKLPDYLQQIEKKVIAAGGHVFWAETGVDAVDYITDLAKKRKVRSIVKSKSMLGEEIRLNHGLEQNNFETIETDLGEFIVQLCGEEPSHIVTPALHKSRGQVSQLFAEKLGAEPTDSIEELTATARKALRKKFLDADLGISGVNFGIAENGAIVVVENEGNARLSISLPRIHVAIMGIEKVIPRVRDLAVFLRLLTRSATGQRMTSYTNLISGSAAENELDGPEEFHLVLIDNGRSKILADAELRETLACIRCGACLNGCPVFQTIGGHAYDSVYQGPIGAILTPQLLSLDSAPDHPFTSSLCGLCRDLCPVMIDIPKILLKLRARVVQSTSKASFQERIGMKLWARIMSSKTNYGIASHFLHNWARWIEIGGKIKPAFGPIRNWQKQRDLPSIPKKGFRKMFRAFRRER
jgi:L-lactate dehydrogenase complex protein LldF